MILKKCRKCCLDLPLTRFQRSNVPKLNGDVIYSSSCIKCRKIAASKGRTRVNKPRVKIVDREDVLIDNIQIYSLIRKLSLNKLKINNIDTFRLVSLYIDVYGDDIDNIYHQQEQLDIMNYKLEKYIMEKYEENRRSSLNDTGDKDGNETKCI